jgi:hypothetical protein
MSEQSPKPDIAAMARKSRQRACELLGLDPNSLRPADAILADRVGVLRVLVADYEAAQLRGEQIDVVKYIAASESLEALVRADRRMVDGSPAAEEDARNRMRQVLMAVAPDLVEQSDREDEAAERAPLELESESEEPDPPAESEPEPPPPSANVRYLSTRRGPNGEHPTHYVKRDPDTFDVPYFPLDPRR